MIQFVTFRSHSWRSPLQPFKGSRFHVFTITRRSRIFAKNCQVAIQAEVSEVLLFFSWWWKWCFQYQSFSTLTKHMGFHGGFQVNPPFFWWKPKCWCQESRNWQPFRGGGWCKREFQTLTLSKHGVIALPSQTMHYYKGNPSKLPATFLLFNALEILQNYPHNILASLFDPQRGNDGPKWQDHLMVFSERGSRLRLQTPDIFVLKPAIPLRSKTMGTHN